MEPNLKKDVRIHLPVMSFMQASQLVWSLPQTSPLAVRFAVCDFIWYGLFATLLNQQFYIGVILNFET